MAKLADGRYHQRRIADLLAGQLDPDGWVGAGDGRPWRQPNISWMRRVSTAATSERFLIFRSAGAGCGLWSASAL